MTHGTVTPITEARSSRTESPSEWKYKMKDLCDATGLPRQAIHFYIQQELVRPGKKTGRNMAWYTEAHLERLRLIKRLQHERFLPLRAIKAVLDGEHELLSQTQHAFLESVKAYLPESMRDEHERDGLLSVQSLVARTHLSADEIVHGFEIGLVGGSKSPTGELSIAEADSWLFDVFAELRAAGFTAERGFKIDDMLIYQESVLKLMTEELRMFARLLDKVPAPEVAKMVQKVLPLIFASITRLHESKVRDFFSTYV